MFEQEARLLKSGLALCIKRIYIGEGLTGNRYETILSDDADELIRKALEAARSQGATNGKTCADCGKGIILGSRIAVDGARRIFHRSCGGAEFAKRQSTIPGTPEYARMEAASKEAEPCPECGHVHIEMNQCDHVSIAACDMSAAALESGATEEKCGCNYSRPTYYADGFRDGQESMRDRAVAACYYVKESENKSQRWSEFAEAIAALPLKEKP